MASAANCVRCLTRPTTIGAAAPRILSQRIVPIITSYSLATGISPFSTSSADSVAARRVTYLGKHIRRGKINQNARKKRDTARVKKPAPGERKAFRKRITLSNNNALAVEGLQDVGIETLAVAENKGSMVALPDQLVDQLRTLEAFKTTQNWGLFRRPHMLIRGETVELAKRLDDAVKERQTLRMVLTGDKVVGKSILLLQGLSHALLNTQDLTNSNTDYSPIPNTKPLQFYQPTYCFNLLQQIVKANGPILKQHKVSKEYPELLHVPKDGTLLDIATAAKEPEFAWPAFQALWHELTTAPGGPPVFLGLDGLSHIMKISAYRDPSFNLVHSHDLTLVRLFIDALSGKTPLANGGAVIAATSRSNAPRSPSMELALAQSAAAAADLHVPTPDPYNKGYDDRVYEAVRGVETLNVSGISREEARAVMEYWAASGLMRARIDETTVVEKWTISGGGVLGELERASLLNSRMLQY
ncbi:37S ribosomal protein S23, mitochondrial [Colletotrichum tanaceti]|uniref:Small ribosomal subunit protein mS29 n=1 Tax=Colletotrichum tanaceti TaxID=1306861 RepID=A0A4U6XJW4_9PEZI|nr:37S ribosomal protein S23, mitochondrial [Colletotrichum tanaceti]KAJ0168824.1 37S ribosomal protein S23, mitochondrial [Colletotrichum tanaceti]TKW56044.1 37S ribosomal protein S23, mitochondrial [Colletotrichum tanaceti]